MAKPSRPGRVVWAFGVALLVGTALGAGWVLNNGGPSTSSQSVQADSVSPSQPAGAVFIGFADVEPGVADLVPLQPGRVVWVIDEGKTVDEGEVLLKIDSRLAEIKVREAEAAVKTAQELLKQAEQGPKQHEHKVEQQKLAVKALEHQKAAAEKEADKVAELHRAGHGTVNDKLAADEMAKKVAALLKLEQNKLLALGDVDPEEAKRQAEANVLLRQAQLDAAKHALSEHTLKAPAAGVVLRVFVTKWELLGPQSKMPALQFAPHGKKIVRAEVLQEWADQVKEGQRVIIEDDTRAGTHWTGTVRRLSDWYSRRRSTILEPFQQNDVRTIECIIDVDTDSAPPLRIGQRVRVKV